MKKRMFLIVAVLMALLPLCSSAQNCLSIHQKDGEKFSYLFRDKPVITYTESELVLTTTKVQVSFPIRKVTKFTFEDVDAAVKPIEKAEATYNLSEEGVIITGAVPGSPVSVYSLDGKIITTFQIDTDGNLCFSIDEFPQGIYIVKSESVSFKLLKK